MIVIVCNSDVFSLTFTLKKLSSDGSFLGYFFQVKVCLSIVILIYDSIIISNVFSVGKWRNRGLLLLMWRLM